jgi:hypothetical protein
MKKFYKLFLSLILLLPAFTGISQCLMLKSELSPSLQINDSRFIVEAWVTDDDAMCYVSWPEMYDPWEYAPDDGEADDYFIYTYAGSIYANRFTPFGYPEVITGGRIYVGDGNFPGPFIGTSFRVLIYDDNGNDGFPGTVLDSIDVTVNNYGWIAFEGFTVEISEGDFYLAMKQLAPSPDAAPVGVDMDNPTYSISYCKYLNNEWILSPLQDFMIRAWTNGYSDPSRSIDYFKIARFSGFDPDASPLLGDTTVLDSTMYSFYEDTLWEDLDPGYYAYGVQTHFTGGEMSDFDVSNIVSHGLNFYPPACFYQADTGSMPLIICPPEDDTGSLPFNFLGYNFYYNSVLMGFLPPETTSFEPSIFFPNGMEPGTYSFCLAAIYDLTPFGYPGETIEAGLLGTDYFLRYGFPLDFLENWDLGNFETNNWTADGPNWYFSSTEGNPFPSAEFSRDPIQNDYYMCLESYPFLADNMTEGAIYLDFDIKLDNANASGTENLLIQVWDWESRMWSTAYSYSNQEGSFDWIPEHLDITDYTMNQVFKIRFAAQGESSLNLLGWYIDNIQVYRFCTAPVSLDVNGLLDGMELEWDGIETNKWIHWDDGEYSGIGIGTGASAEFDAAVRWTPEQLSYFDGDTLTEIAFVPKEEAATYRIRVWIGQGAANLIYDWEVADPVIDTWNYIPLIYPVIVDADLELWVGYNVETPVGYPAGVDDGPAIDGYGNMIDFGGWQTLKQVNPDLDYNWNIAAYLRHNMDGHQVKYAIYRSDDFGPFFIRDYTDESQYLDDSVCMAPPWYHNYKITTLLIYEGDTCESDFSNEDYDNCIGIKETLENPLHIYPNPASDVLYIESSEEIESASIIDCRGQTLEQWNNETMKQQDGARMEIPLSGLAPGLYLVKVELGDVIITRKIIVKH